MAATYEEGVLQALPIDDKGQHNVGLFDPSGAKFYHPRAESATNPNLRVVLYDGATKLSSSSGVVLGAGTNLVGKVGIDQTTPGTTNRVDIGTVNTVAPVFAGVTTGQAATGMQNVIAGMRTTSSQVSPLSSQAVAATYTEMLSVVGNMTNAGVPSAMTAASQAADGASGSTALQVSSQAYNGSTFDRVRNNIAGTLLASAARTTTTSSADQTSHNGQAVAVTVNVTAVPGIETITVTIEAKDPVSGAYTTILTSAALVATGTVRLRVGTNIAAAVNLAAADVLGRTWRVTVTPSASGSFTYSVGYDVMTA